MADSAGMDLINAIGELRQFAHSLGARMDRVAHALSITGNDKLAEEIGSWIDALDGISERVSKAHGSHLTAELRQAEQGTTNILKALLAGVEVASKGRVEK